MRGVGERDWPWKEVTKAMAKRDGGQCDGEEGRGDKLRGYGLGRRREVAVGGGNG